MWLDSRLSRLASAVLVVAAALAPGASEADDRSTELFVYRCSNELGRRDVTLFANGTVRVRQGMWEAQALYLDELLPEEKESYVARLREFQAAADPMQTQLPGGAPQGDWVERCVIHLDLPGAPAEEWQFSTLQVPPLVVSHLVQLAEDLAAYTRAPASVDRVPGDYEPRRGDVLRDVDGDRFRVIGLTTDRRAVELEGLDSPLRVFVPVEELSNAFQALEERGRR